MNVVYYITNHFIESLFYKQISSFQPFMTYGSYDSTEMFSVLFHECGFTHEKWVAVVPLSILNFAIMMQLLLF